MSILYLYGCCKKVGLWKTEGIFRTFLVDNLVDFVDIIVWKSAEECYSDDRVSELRLILLDIGLPHKEWN